MRIIAATALCALWVGPVAAGPGAAGPNAGVPERPWLGIGIEDGLRGARVTEVIDGTPAQFVGLRVGDEIVAVDGQPVSRTVALTDALSHRQPGERVAVTVWRYGKSHVVRPELSAMLDEDEILHRRLVDKQAPAFSLPVLSGSASGKLEAHLGKVVVVAFWATWCGPCKEIYQPLSQLAARYPHRVVVLGLTSEDRSTVTAFVRDKALGFTVLQDRSGVTRQRYRTDKTPTLVVIGGDGLVRFAGMGGGPNVSRAMAAAERAIRAGELRSY